MPDVETLEIEIGDDAPLFRRRLAIVVVFITLFGAAIAYLHVQNSNLEDNAAREAQLQAIRGFGRQVKASTEFQFDYRLFVQRQLLERQHLIAADRQRSAADPSASAYYDSESQRWTRLRDAVGQGAAVQDAQGAGAIDGQLQVAPDIARLTQKAYSNKSNDYFNKADAYVALLTVLAVALFLIGLSLTVSGRGRYFLAAPGIAIAVVCVGWGVFITTREIRRVSAHAIQLTAEGQQLAASGDPNGAIEKYKAALDESPNFGPAYARLSDAEFTAGGQSAGKDFLSISDPEATKRAVNAGEKAISLGENDPGLVSGIGFFHFTLGNYARAEELAQQALRNNAEYPPIIFNLGVVQVARGAAAAAEATYEHGIAVLADQQDNGLGGEIIEAAHTDLEIAEDKAPGNKDLAEKMKGLLAVAEARLYTAGQSGMNVPSSRPADGSVTDATIEVDEFNRLQASYGTDGFEPNTVLMNVWYYRPPGRSGPFEQVAAMDSVTVTAPQVLPPPVENGDCLASGDYRLEVYAGPGVVASADFTRETSPLGTMTVAGGEDVGVTVCHPDDWQTEDTGLPGALAFTNPNDRAEGVIVLSFPLGTELASSGPAVLEAMIQSVLQQEGAQPTAVPVSGQDLLGRSVERADVFLPTTTVIAADAAGDTVRITGSFGDDGVVRLVAVSAHGSDRLGLVTQELLNSVRFLRAPKPSK